MSGLTRGLAVVGALGAATTGGALYAFSSFVMRALRSLDPEVGVSAMQAINREAPTPSFMVPMFGTAAVGVALAVSAAGRLDQRSAQLALAGSVLYLAGVAVTVGYHVPMNDRLAGLTSRDPATTTHWLAYQGRWTVANHIRTATMLAGSLCWVGAAATRS